MLIMIITIITIAITITITIALVSTLAVRATVARGFGRAIRPPSCHLVVHVDDQGPCTAPLSSPTVAQGYTAQRTPHTQRYSNLDERMILLMFMLMITISSRATR